MTKQVIRFNIEITETASFRLEVEVNELLTCDVETLAREEMIRMQGFGHHKDLDFEKFNFHNKIKFVWQGWI